MQLIRKRVKSLGLATVFAVIVGSILSFSLNKPISASAYELHPTGNRAVYDGYTSAPSGNWYSDNLTVSNSPMITVLTHGLMADASTWSNNYNGNPNMSNFGEKENWEKIIGNSTTPYSKRPYFNYHPGC